MATDTQDYIWEVEQDETETLYTPVADGDTPLTVTGWTVDAKIRVNPGGPVIYTFPGSAIEITGDDDNIVKLTLHASVSAAWAFSVAWLRIKITDPDSPIGEPVRYRVLQGHVLISRD